MRLHTPRFKTAALCDQLCLHYGVPHTSAVRCSQVQLASKRCQEPGCRKRPCFGFPGRKPQFCAQHKPADMVCHSGIGVSAALPMAGPYLSPPLQLTALCSVAQMNVVSPRCEVAGCTLFASCGRPGGRRRTCGKHKLDGMVSKGPASSRHHIACMSGSCSSALAFL